LPFSLAMDAKRHLPAILMYSFIILRIEFEPVLVEDAGRVVDLRPCLD
jgi:hypothetical protein